MGSDIIETLEFDVVRGIVADFCLSPLGKSIAANLNPTRKVPLARRLILQVSEMKGHLEGGGLFPSQGARDVVGLIGKALEMNRAVDPEELCSVSGLLACSSRLRSVFKGKGEEMPEIVRLVDGMEDLADLESDLNRTVDKAGRILSTASERLFSLRAKKENLAADVRRRAEAYLADGSVAKWLQDRTVRLRRDRFVLPVRTECGGRVKGVVHGYSASGNTVFIEPEGLVEKQNQLMKVTLRENREISTILWEKTRVLIDSLDRIRRSQRVVAWLDFTFGRARFSIVYRLTPPELTDEPVLVLREARHPILLKLAIERGGDNWEERIDELFAGVVPLGLSLGERFDILVITGPNTGGKTVALKTAGLLAMMASSGLHVPAAAGSRLPVYNAVLADIGDEQDIFQNLSTFSSHIRRIAAILDRADGRSLVLLDELGSGTDPQEGEALGRAILNFLLHRGVKVLVTTHLSKLKEFAFSHDGVENGCMEFDPDSLKPVFKLVIGMPGESNAIRISRRLGLPESVLDDARKTMSSSFDGTQKLMDGISRARTRVEAELDRSRAEAQDLKTIKREIEETRNEVAWRKKLLEEEAEREIDSTLRGARDDALALVGKLRNVPAPHLETVDKLERILDQLVERTSLAEKRRAFVDTLKKGDLVYIPRFREQCRVVKIGKKDGTVHVGYRNMTVVIPYREVMWPHWF
jgi:DNA mismatch repair protein MutS2